MPNNDKLNALLNVAIFTPIAFYIAQGKRPPTWMTAASLAILGVSFVRDLNTIFGGQPLSQTVQDLLPPPPLASPSLYPKQPAQ